MSKLPVKEGYKRIRINVTNEDIEKGNKGSIWHCPVALAVKRRLPEKHLYVTNYGYVVIETRDIVLSQKVQDFIDDFDGWKNTSFNSFSFYIKVPEELINVNK